MRLNIKLIAVIGILASVTVGFYSCGDILQIESLAINEQETKKVINNNTEERVIMIYDYNKDNKSLEYQAKTVRKSTGNPLRDAIKVFIKENNFNQDYTDFDITDIRTTKNATIFHFTGDLGFASQSDSLLYWNALRMTVARNSNLTNFSFQIN